MSLHLGNVPASTVLYIPFDTISLGVGSITITGLAVTDIEIYKDGSTTQRASDAGYALLDTDGIDFDGITGIHGFSVDLADNTTAGFYAVGSQYWVVVSAITVDGQTVNFIAATFRIVAAQHTAGYPVVTIKDGTGTGELDTASGVVLAKDHVGASLATATALDTVDNFLDTEITDIQARLPAALVSGRIDASVGAMAANVMTAAAAAADLTTELQSGLATAAALTTIDDFLDTEVAAILAAVDTEVAAIKAKTDLIPGTIDGKTFSELVTLIAAVLLGKASGLATTTAVYRAVDDAKDRVTATVDASGNRSAVTLDAA